MARNLPVLVVQCVSRFPDGAVSELRVELLELLQDFPSTRLVVYPEYHLCRVTGGPEERRRQYEACAEPLEGPRVDSLRELANEAGVWLLPGTVVERGEQGEI